MVLTLELLCLNYIYTFLDAKAVFRVTVWYANVWTSVSTNSSPTAMTQKRPSSIACAAYDALKLSVLHYITLHYIIMSTWHVNRVLMCSAVAAANVHSSVDFCVPRESAAISNAEFNAILLNCNLSLIVRGLSLMIMMLMRSCLQLMSPTCDRSS